ncbi:MAG TPA: Shedu anti-phage system protein SduA domain-containing protein, partial [Myxococcales bacterium]
FVDFTSEGHTIEDPGARTPMVPSKPQPGTIINVPPMYRNEPKSTMIIAVAPPEGALAMQAGTYTMRAAVRNATEYIGYLDCHLIQPAPLTEERKAAIRASAVGAKSIRVELACSTCGTAWKAYAALERDDSAEALGYTWYTSLPQEARCNCGKFSADLGSMRSNLHGFLGSDMRAPMQFSLVPTYHRRALENVLKELIALLDSRPREEQVQQFLTDHPVILGQFGPQWLLPKAPILTMHCTDFALLNPKNELVLIEIERPTLKLMPKKGGPSAELLVPVRQLNDWFHEIDEHRAAVLACMKLAPADVTGVRGVVIAGRNEGYDKEHLQKLKKWDFGRKIEFLTYDDLISGFTSVIRNIGPD